LLAAIGAARIGHRLIIPADNALEASLVAQCHAAVANHLLEVVDHMLGSSSLEFVAGTGVCPQPQALPDLDEVRGQAHAKRALEIAAAGQHSLFI
jgi:magnesium chelatase family protein